MKKLRLSRPMHGALCILAMLLTILALRLFCGPPSAWSPKAALRQAERQYLLFPGEVETNWERMRYCYMAVRGRDGQLRLFQTQYTNDQTFVDTDQHPKKRYMVYFYDPAVLLPDSGDVPWDGASFSWSGFAYTNDSMHSAKETHLLMENGDQAAQRAEFHCTSVSRRDGQEPYARKWSASAERLTPRLFDLTLTYVQDSVKWVNEASLAALAAIGSGGYSYLDWQVELDGEVIWYDADGRELYRQTLDFRQEEKTEAGT